MPARNGGDGPHPVDRVFGRLKLDRPVDALIDDMRGQRPAPSAPKRRSTRRREHPELIAERIGRYARLVGREKVIADNDCGFGTWVGQAAVDPDVAWAKLASLTEGARLATRASW
jgi:hypothetical protein